MTFFHNSEWLGYLAENIIQKCLSLSFDECSGCKDNMKSPLLHLHNQQSLLEKIQHHFEPVRGETLNSLTTLYKNIESKLPHSEDKKKDLMIYCNVGRHFLITCSPQVIYYGRYVTELNDSFIAEVLDNGKKCKLGKRNTTKK